MMSITSNYEWIASLIKSVILEANTPEEVLIIVTSKESLLTWYYTTGQNMVVCKGEFFTLYNCTDKRDALNI